MPDQTPPAGRERTLTLHRTPLDQSTRAVLYELVSPEGAVIMTATLFDARYDSAALESALASLHPAAPSAERHARMHLI